MENGTFEKLIVWSACASRSEPLTRRWAPPSPLSEERGSQPPAVPPWEEGKGVVVSLKERTPWSPP